MDIVWTFVKTPWNRHFILWPDRSGTEPARPATASKALSPVDKSSETVHVIHRADKRFSEGKAKKSPPRGGAQAHPMSQAGSIRGECSGTTSCRPWRLLRTWSRRCPRCRPWRAAGASWVGARWP